MRKPKQTAWNGSKSAAENARVALPAMVAEYFAAGRKLQQGARSIQALHDFRLASKHLRYTLELFRPCYGPGLERCIEALRELQGHLGELNDCATTRQLIANHNARPSPQRERVERFLGDRSEQSMARFREAWQTRFDAPGRERWWINYLTRFAGRNKKS